MHYAFPALSPETGLSVWWDEGGLAFCPWLLVFGAGVDASLFLPKLELIYHYNGVVARYVLQRQVVRV